MIKRNYEMEVLINGSTVKEYFHNHKTYIEGRKDSVFSIKLKNNSSEKALFVPTVDGLSVMNGKDGSFDSQGYILDAHSSMKIDGWRLSDDEVAEFYFSTVNDSYRKRKGNGINVGSIAIAVFREKENHICNIPFIIDVKPEKEPYRFPQPRLPFDDYIYHPRLIDNRTVSDDPNILLATCSNNGNLSTSGSHSVFTAASQDIGTGFGETKRSEVISVSFDKESNPDAVLEVFYNTRKQLKKIGVDLNRQRYSISEPNSFPNESGYCKRPNN